MPVALLHEGVKRGLSNFLFVSVCAKTDSLTDFPAQTAVQSVHQCRYSKRGEGIDIPNGTATRSDVGSNDLAVQAVPDCIR